MSTITTKDGTQIYFKDWGPKNAQPIVFHHGWPLSADDWDAQMLFFLGQGYRVVAHDRRGDGRSSHWNASHPPPSSLFFSPPGGRTKAQQLTVPRATSGRKDGGGPSVQALKRLATVVRPPGGKRMAVGLSTCD